MQWVDYTAVFTQAVRDDSSGLGDEQSKSLKWVFLVISSEPILEGFKGWRTKDLLMWGNGKSTT